MTTFQTITWMCYLAAAVCFVLGLHLMNSPATGRRGNLLSAAGMGLAIVTTMAVLLEERAIGSTGVIVLLAGGALGAGAGLYAARSVAMTAMPQLVSVFNAVGGGAAALLAVNDLAAHGYAANGRTSIAGSLDILIGAVTFTGSLIAAGKLQGIVPGRPMGVPGGRAGTTGIGVAAIAAAGWLAWQPDQPLALITATALALAFGITMVLPIGGADMPVVISLLNAFTGTAVAMAGFVLNNTPLIIAGALVGASGAILTRLMAVAMNRSVMAIIAGGFGTGDGAAGPAVDGSIRQVNVDDVATQLAYATKVVVVPGYGLAAAQAQHELAELADALEARGIDVSYAIHPVAGRMPGHMNVLLAEANVPYPLMRELEEANTELPRADVALVVGANDVTNPAARRPGNAVSGMPILDVDRARSVVVIKRSMGHGYAGIENELYSAPGTGMLFADAKQGLTAILAAVKTLVG